MAPTSGHLKTGWDQYRPFVLVFAGLAFVNAAVQIADLWAQRTFGHVIDAVTSWKGEASWYLTPKVPVLVAEVLVASFLALALRKLGRIWSAKRIDFDLPAHVGLYAWRQIVALSVGRHDLQHSGFMSVVGHRGQRSTSALAVNVVQTFLYVGLRILITTSAILYFYPECGLTVVIGIIGFSALTWYINARFNIDITLSQENALRRDRLQSDLAQNISVVQLNAQETRVETELASAFLYHAKFARRVYTRFHSWSFVPGAMPTIGKICVLTMGVFLVSHERIRPGELVVCIVWASEVLDHLQWMHDINHTLVDQLLSAKSYLQLLQSRPVQTANSYPAPYRPFEGRIEFRNVSFEYPIVNGQTEINQSREPSRMRPRQWAIRNVSFSVGPGEQLAIIGPSGAGKSTLFKLLLGLHDPDEGQILVDGVDIRALNLKQLRQAVGLVQQNATLLDRSLRDNILFGVDTATIPDEKWLADVIRISGIQSMIDMLPAGMDTHLGQNGERLSGGERQRVTIARALAKRPTILLFDEATSQLDAETEREIREAICESCHGRTAIIISHQLRTFVNANRILILDNGSVVAEGNHDALLAASSWYRTIAQYQSGSSCATAVEF